MSIENKGPGGVSNSYGRRTTSNKFDLSKKYDRHVSVDSTGNLVGPNGNVIHGNAYSSTIDGVTGDYFTTGKTSGAQLQTAINNAIAAGAEELILPAGDIYLEQGVQIWGGYGFNAPGRLWMNGLRIRGSGIGRTRIWLAPGIVGLWWHTAENLTSPNSSTQINAMKNAGGGGFSMFGAGIGQGNVGIRVGGKRSNMHDVMTNITFSDVYITDVDSVWQDDDCTLTRLSNFNIGVFKYGFEHGYNCDDFRWESGYYGHEDSYLMNVTPSGITAAGISSFTVPDSLDSFGTRLSQKIKPGWNINLPGVFPAGTYVGSVSSNGTNVTVTAVDYTGSTAVTSTAASGGALVSFFIGRVHCYGPRVYVAPSAGYLYPQYGSPWTPPYSSIGKTSTTLGRENANNHSHSAIAGGRIELFAKIEGPSHFNLFFDDVYVERMSGMYRIGDAGSVLGAKNVHVTRNYPNFSYHLLEPWINMLGDSHDASVFIRDNKTDVDSTSTTLSTTQPWVSTSSYGNQIIVWENNDLPIRNTSTSYQLIAYSAQYGPASDQLGRGAAVYVGSARRGDAKQSFSPNGTQGWNYFGQDVIKLTLQGSSTLNNPNAQVTGQTGKNLTIHAIQNGTGGYTLTLGSQFLKADGTAWGTIASGTANKGLTLDFVYNGTNFVSSNTTTGWA